MTPEELEALLAALGPNREKYEAVRRKLVRLFEWRGFASPEDLANETFKRVARRMAQRVGLRSTDPFGYFCGVAHLLYKEAVRRKAREHYSRPPESVRNGSASPRLPASLRKRQRLTASSGVSPEMTASRRAFRRHSGPASTRR